ncbi:hypothetical protein Tco_0840490 [Tanacetum coccineum]|uniref:Reverse transcriptase domain-containing protein n=1 Tax=Tanacetum coccineum TaxID=301880 RepID=A0ABQ5AXA3_9ASTR
MDTVKFKAPPPIIGPAENQNKNKFCEFHGDKGHSIDECIHLRRQIEEAVKSRQLSHLVKEIKQGGKRGEQAKAAKKGEAPNKEKAMAIFMVQPWQRITRQKTTQSFFADQKISFSTLGDNSGQETPIVIEVEVECHLIHRMSLSPYNGIIGHPGLRKIQAVPSTAHGMLKFPMKGGIATIRSSTIMPAECRMVTEAQDASLPREPTAAEGIKVAIHPEYPKQSVTIGGSLSEKGRMELYNLLKENLDIFAWKPADMTGAPNRNKVIQEEVAKLVEAEIMREVHYHDWLSNSVMAKKHNGSWRMCVDFTDLNKSCPKDCYPLPEIDWKVESLCGYPFKCLLDAYKGYHQIQMAEEDEEKMAFHTNQ